MRKILVAGCSFSDYSCVDIVYGEILSDLLGAEYIHEGSGCGSNHRMWRVVGNHILDGNLTENDILIVQYTSVERKEFWSHNQGETVQKKQVNLNEPYRNKGSLMKFKSSSSQWQRFQEEKDFLDLFEKYFCSTDYEMDWFKIMNSYFESFLLAKKIRTIFLETNYFGGLYQLLNEDPHKKLYYRWNKNLIDESLRLPNDYYHLSSKGHLILAQDLSEHIKSNLIVS